MYLKNILPFVFLGEDKSKFYALTVGEGIWFDGDIEVVLVCYFTTHSDFSSYVFQVYNSDGRLLEYRSCDESNMTVDSMLVKALYYFNIEPHAWRLYPKKCMILHRSHQPPLTVTVQPLTGLSRFDVRQWQPHGDGITANAFTTNLACLQRMKAATVS